MSISVCILQRVTATVKMESVMSWANVPKASASRLPRTTTTTDSTPTTRRVEVCP